MHIFIISIPQRLSSRTPLLFWKKWMRDLYFSASRPFFIPHRRPCFSNGSHHAVPRLSLLRRRGYSPAKLENHAKCVVGCLFIKKIPPEFTPQGGEAERFLGKYIDYCIIPPPTPPPPGCPAAHPIIRKIALTMIQDRPMIARPTAACWRILNHFLYLVSSPAAVTILNPPRSKTTKAIKDKSPNTQLMKIFITFMIPPHVPHAKEPAPATPTSVVSVTVPNHCACTIP